jgi:hypothetical protein
MRYATGFDIEAVLRTEGLAALGGPPTAAGASLRFGEGIH